jgi:ABC-2 type transport system ATP-binding protein
MRHVIVVEGLRKYYGQVRAVEEVSFDVDQGEIFGLIGPNGAGKTTTLECVEGLRVPDAGRIRLFDLDPVRDAAALQPRVGVQLQESHLQKRITVWEAVDLWASLYRQPVDGTRLLDQLGLYDKRNAWFMTLSGGQKQRLFIALALIHDPEMVFLDELTTGLDPQARRAIWELVRGIRARGKTVVLTTHLMEEAERLCDRVAIVDHGRVIDIGTPEALVRRHCPEHGVAITTDDPRAAALLAGCRSVSRVEPSPHGGRAGRSLVVHGTTEDLLDDVLACLTTNGVHVTGVQSQTATLEDVFLRLTGHSIRS